MCLSVCLSMSMQDICERRKSMEREWDVYVCASWGKRVQGMCKQGGWEKGTRSVSTGKLRERTCWGMQTEQKHAGEVRHLWMCVYIQVQGGSGKHSATGYVQLCVRKKAQEMRALVSKQGRTKDTVHASRERLVGRLSHYTPSLGEVSRECQQWQSCDYRTLQLVIRMSWLHHPNFVHITMGLPHQPGL